MLIILDDDPTGTQTTRGLPVLTEWTVDALKSEIDRDGEAFFILTNSRALTEKAAIDLNQTIARNLSVAAAGRKFTLVSRGDSTLRGHFPLETDVLSAELGPFDATFLIPFFEAGGRITQEDVHYVREGERLIPVGETPFAKDPTFGFSSSNLKDYIVEKSHGRIATSEVFSLSLEVLRSGVGFVRDAVVELPEGCHCIVNATLPSDLQAFAAGLKLAEKAGRRFLFRTAAEFVAAYLGQATGELLDPAKLGPSSGIGGLIVVGSHVPKSTVQLERLISGEIMEPIELNVASLLNEDKRAAEIDAAGARMAATLGAGRDAVLFTSRKRIDGLDGESSLEIAGKVSSALVELVGGLNVRPRYLVAKGGITSSDLATKALRVKRAIVVGQILPGVPVWEIGEDSLFPGLLYVVFPGNVGSEDALVRLAENLSIK
ncbi:four-carbon acid sugar kinase family protein [Luteolibacter algae]|uniref:Four-carbon acid sugar kinase family protein n=1 Tax=Luteolibacter algae TaxID=454151 RepID=A0ABW5D9L1_9BACT